MMSQSVAQRESLLLAPYAVHSVPNPGRRYPEPEHPYRGPFQRDRDRVTHSSAFRRLSDKTQVFTGDMGDYHRTRLTHTLEVASLARTLGRALRLNEDLIEALALAHDLGHPPFGHAGEDALDECLREYGGFCHNRQALVIVEELERRYPDFPGLNLTWETLAGQRSRVDKTAPRQDVSLEAQVVDAADSVAYDTHDADDALELKMLTFEDLTDIPLWREAADRVRQKWPSLRDRQMERALVRELIDWQVSDLLECSQQRILECGVDSPEAAKCAGLLIGPSPAMAKAKAELERFLHVRVYRRSDVMQTRRQVTSRLCEMFQTLLDHPERLPGEFAQRVDSVGPPRAVGDYLACLTDRSALDVYARMFPHSAS